jgi:Secretion system C-terminal sorting domain
MCKESSGGMMVLVVALVCFNGISISTIYEQNLKLVNELYLFMQKEGGEAYDETQKQSIRDIANQCPTAGGEGVWIARSLRKAFEEVGYEDEIACLSIGIQMRHGKQEDVVFSLSPNPTTDFTMLSLKASFDEELDLQITDMVGNHLFVDKIPAREKAHIIDTNNFPNGIYLLRVYKGNKLLGAEKLVVIK